jgi:hypothetical protein
MAPGVGCSRSVIPGLWGAILVFLGGRRIPQALRYPGLVRATFWPSPA